MAKSNRQSIVKQLHEDRQGLIEYGQLIEKNITQLHKRLLKVKGALQYVNQILETLK